MTFPASTQWTQLVSLGQMRNTVRRLTARYNPQQMPDTQIDSYINLAYTIHFPEQFRNLKLNRPFVFNTVPNVDTYQFIYEQGIAISAVPAPNNVIPGSIQISPPVYCQGYLLRYYQDKTSFYNRWPRLSVNQIIKSGNNTPGPYAGTVNPFPFMRAQLDVFGVVTEPAVVISAIVQNPQARNSGYSYVLTDQPVVSSNVGNLVDNQNNIVGTINYLTGAYTFTSETGVIPSNATIFASVVPYQSSRPTDVLFYNQQIVMRPVPQQVYQVEFQISQQPTQLIAANQAPELDVWYLFICCLAAELIYADFPDESGMAYLRPILDEQRLIAQRTSLRQMSSQRAQTIFSQPGWSRNMGTYFYGSEFSGGVSS